MTGTTRESVRPAMRKRPSDSVPMSGSPSTTLSKASAATNAPPPVLFRLPSIALPGMGLAGVDAMVTDHGLTAVPARTAAIPQSVPAPIVEAPSPAVAAAAHIASVENAEKRRAGQRLLNTLIVILLLAALVVISLLAFRKHEPTPEVANDKGTNQDPLASLSDLKLPDMTAAVQTPAASNAPATTKVDENPESLLQGLTGQPIASESASKEASPGQSPALVQLGTPVPVRESTNASLTESPSRSLPLTTPRYETVSAPTNTKNPGGDFTVPTAKKNDTTSTPNNGGSPSMWDGAKRNAEPDRELSSGLTLSLPVASEISKAETAAGQSPTAPAGDKLELMGQSLTLGPSTSQGGAAAAPAMDPVQAKPGPSVESQPLGVTVGGGLTEPGNLNTASTATPDMDVAGISQRYIEYSQQKRAQEAASSLPNAYAPNAYAPASTPANPVSGGYNGPTSATVTPYVRNAPNSSQPSGMQPSGMQPSRYPAQTGAYAPAPNAPANNYGASPYAPQYAAPSNPGGMPPSGQMGTYQQPRPQMPTQMQPQMQQPMQPQMQQPQVQNPYLQPNQGYAVPGNTAGGMVNPANYGNASAPVGMIGQSGFATAPTGDVIGRGPIPVMGKVGVGTSAPSGPGFPQ